jgi:S-adenosylmethionine decarboxylase
MISNSPSYEFKGKHYIANFMDCHCMDLQTIKKGFEQAILKSGATILGKSDYVFENDGLTMVFLLSESHASIHTYPEHKSVFIDFFTCGDSVDHIAFHDAICDLFKPEKIKIENLER